MNERRAQNKEKEVSSMNILSASILLAASINRRESIAFLIRADMISDKRKEIIKTYNKT
jgi:hypothetical protein